MPWVDDGNASLVTDLYELTMAAVYHAHGHHDHATFELSMRSLPPERNFAIVAGIADVTTYLERLRFDARSLAYLASLDRFDRGFLDFLAGLRFTGDLWAMPEGTPVFAGEPVLRITAPLIEAQIVETFVLNAVGHQTMVASKAARVALAAAGRPFVDFGARRSHAADAALKGARAAYLGGAAATSLVLAGLEYGIPVSGTMAHSYILAHASEEEAFRRYARAFPSDAVLLIDTYDTIEGARIAARVACDLADEGVTVGAVRLDSGDLGTLAGKVRSILDEAGAPQVRILVSGGLDEHDVERLVTAGAPIDGFGVGTRMVTSEDAPSLDVVYKLVEDATGPKMKTSTGKVTLPGVKQVYRAEHHGMLQGDVIGLARGEHIAGTPLLRPIMTAGRVTTPPDTLEAARHRCRETLALLPPALQRLAPGPAYPVTVSPGITRLVATLSG